LTARLWTVLGLFLLCSCGSCGAKPAGAREVPLEAPTGGSATPTASGHALATAPSEALTADPGDLPHILERGELRVLIESEGEAFLPREGLPIAYERALAERFARRLGVPVRFVLVSGFDALVPALNAGKGDLIAAALTVTHQREEAVAFTWPLTTVDEVLVGKKGAKGLPKTVAQLAGRKVYVRKSSSYAESLATLAKAGTAVQIAPVPETLEPEEIVYRVSRGEWPLTVVDSNLLEAIQAYNPDVQRLFPIAEGRRIAWAVRKDNPKLLARLNAFLVEKALTRESRVAFQGDLDGIKKRGVLRVLTRNNPVTYFLHRGKQYGFDYELMMLAAEELGVRLEMVVPPSSDRLIPWLLAGKGDVIAASFTVTPERAKRVRFTRPYLFVQELVVQPASEAPLTKLEQLAGRKIVVRRSSSYDATLRGLLPRYGPFEITAAPEDLETETLIDQVAEGKLPLTVADSDLVEVEQAYGTQVQAALALVPPGEEDGGKKAIAYAVRPSNPKLLAFLDGFVKRTYRGLRYNMAKKRYFQSPRTIADAKTGRAGKTGQISQWDALFRKYATRYGLDWRLAAAQSFQESRFDPAASSWVGAQGLFQVMPATGKALGFEHLSDPDEGVHAGLDYLSRQLNRVDPGLPFAERVRLALAAYNVGMGHVLDARRVAARKGLDPDRWEGVKQGLLLLQKPEIYRHARYGYCRGSEPVAYVSQIQQRYRSYVKLVQARPKAP
jgi:membrane-bound lytic murein transglycosylase F